MAQDGADTAEESPDERVDEDQVVQPVADPRTHSTEIKHGKRRVVVRLGFGSGLGPRLGFWLAELWEINQREYLVQIDHRGGHSPSASD